MFALSTTAQNRASDTQPHKSRRTSRGRTAVSVYFVKSCCRPSTTMTKPSEYPALSRSRLHGWSGRPLWTIARVRNEKPIERPAARPDQNSAPALRSSSSFPSLRQNLVRDLGAQRGMVRRLFLLREVEVLLFLVTSAARPFFVVIRHRSLVSLRHYFAVDELAELIEVAPTVRLLNARKRTSPPRGSKPA